MSDDNRPNILVIFSDTHGAWATGCYGSDVAVTPHIDRLASEGIVFDRAYSQNPLCVPSRQSMITGKYSCQTGVLQNDTPMPRLYTIADHLSLVGYETAALGKMHFIPDTECSLGKERHQGFARRIDYEEFWWYLRNERGFAPLEGFPDDPWRIVHLEKAQHALQWPKVATPGGMKPNALFGTWGTLPHEDHQEAMVLREWRRFLSEKRERSFLAFVSFQSPHPPLIPPPEFLDLHRGAIPLPLPVGDDIRRHPIWGKRVHGADDRRRAEYLRHYYAFVSYMDWCVGEVLRMLDEAGLRDRTLAVYLSDHGDMGFRHGMTGKTVFYEESVRVPLIVRTPDGIGAGRRHTGLVELLDIFPTFCETAGVAPPPELPGRSLWKDQLSGRDGGKETVFSESYPMRRNAVVFGPRPHRMVLTDRWKLIQYGDICVDLFDVTTDPANNHNLAPDPLRHHTVEELLDRLDRRLGPLPSGLIVPRRES